MNIPSEELDRWEEAAVFMNAQFLTATVAIERGDRETAADAVREAQERNNLTRRALIRSGARDSAQARLKVLAEASGRPIQDHTPPFHLLDSPANRRYARALREAYEALQQVERERGWEDDMSDALLLDVEAAEAEVYGPAGLRGLEG